MPSQKKITKFASFSQANLADQYWEVLSSYVMKNDAETRKQSGASNLKQFDISKSFLILLSNITSR
jgi:hypothetical protein